ncbi:hypothetical protein HanIR_Chr12g0610771 [Helianthus annuus]|nr:hypothetical protein HanIR_Chr12g0610771 [Helianthus annuus]
MNSEQEKRGRYKDPIPSQLYIIDSRGRVTTDVPCCSPEVGFGGAFIVIINIVIITKVEEEAWGESARRNLERKKERRRCGNHGERRWGTNNFLLSCFIAPPLFIITLPPLSLSLSFFTLNYYYYYFFFNGTCPD